MIDFEIEKRVDAYKNGVWCHWQEANPSRVTAHAHIHDAIELIYIQEGGYTVFLDEVEYKLSAGDLILIRSGVIHHVIANADEKHSYYVVKLHQDILRGIASPQAEYIYTLALSLSGSGAKCHWTKTELPPETKAGLEAIIRDFREELPFEDISLKLASGSILLGLLRTDLIKTDSVSLGRETAKYVYEAILFIRRNYMDEITAESMARRLNISYSYFSRIFKKVTGKSFNEYLNDVRISRAEHILLASDKSISETALACGYNDVSYFIKVFHKHKGHSPKLYQKKRSHHVI